MATNILLVLQNSKRLVELRFNSDFAREIPSFKLFETETSFAFLDIGPLSKGHALVIPKYHAEKVHQLPDSYMTDILPIAKKIALAQGIENYNILQNNGKIAHQIVPHVHFHVIPKPAETDKEGLVIGWPTQDLEKEEIAKFYEELKVKIAAAGTADPAL